MQATDHQPPTAQPAAQPNPAGAPAGHAAAAASDAATASNATAFADVSAAPDAPALGGAELAAWLRLSETPGVGPTAAGALLAALNDPPSIFRAEPDTLSRLLGEALPPARVAEAVQALRHPGAAVLDEAARQTDAALAWHVQPGNAVLTLHSPGYPPQLREIPNPPLLLYIKGRRELLARPALAMVGSRNASMQGMANAEHFAAALSRQGVTIVSGLALGIDAAAHRGGLAGGGSTVAVIGTGIDRSYPARNHELALRIADQGCIVSEYPLGTRPLSANFPRRNRVISGLARGVLVVEAAVGSGSLITTRYALAQGRDVFAIPGSIHSSLSKGCNDLIKQGARLVETVDDVLGEVLPGARSERAGARAAVTLQLKEELEALLLALGHDPAGAEALALRAGLAPAAAQGHLLALELAGLVERLPGGIFQRIKT